jgi:hypothetical protein
MMIQPDLIALLDKPQNMMASSACGRGHHANRLALTALSDNARMNGLRGAARAMSRPR